MEIYQLHLSISKLLYNRKFGVFFFFLGGGGGGGGGGGMCMTHPM